MSVDDIAVHLIKYFIDLQIKVNTPQFTRDFALVIDTLRGLIYRDFKREHLATVLIDKIIDIQYNEKGEVQPVINYSRVLEQKDMPGQKLDFGDEPEKEIHFEPDFEIPIPPEDDDK